MAAWRGRRTRGHLDIDPLDQLTERRLEPVARLRQVDLDLGDDPTGVGREHQDAVAHEHRLLDVVRDQDHALDRELTLAPEIEKVGAQGLRRQHVERRERLVHQQDVRMDDERAGEADALPHATRELPRIGGLEAVEPDQVDRGERAAPDLRLGQAQGLEPDLDVLEHRQPGKQREALEHHGDAGRGADDRLAEIADGPRRSAARARR